MFKNCSSLIDLNLKSFKKSSVSNIENMFKDCQKLTSLDLSDFEINPSSMAYMFQNCYSLEYLNIPKILTDDWKYYGNNLFENCYSLKYLNLSNFRMKTISSLSYMFKNCYSLTSIDLPNFDTENIRQMTSTFENCGNLTSLDLSHFKTSIVTDMSNMFNNCSNLAYLKINFDTKNVQKMEYMFASCIKLTSLNISTFNTSKCKNFNFMFENDEGLDLYVDNKTCENLIEYLPTYINIHDIHENITYF